MKIWIVDDSGLYGDIYFWCAEVEDKNKTYKVLEAWNYAGNGHGSPCRSLFLLRSYKKNDKRVFLYFEEAQKKAIETAERMIERQEENLKDNKEKLEKWKT